MRRITGVQIITAGSENSWRGMMGFSHRGVAMNDIALKLMASEWGKFVAAKHLMQHGTYIMLEIEREEMP